MCIAAVVEFICLSCICWSTYDNIWCLFICASNSTINQCCCATSTFLSSSEAGVLLLSSLDELVCLGAESSVFDYV